MEIFREDERNGNTETVSFKMGRGFGVLTHIHTHTYRGRERKTLGGTVALGTLRKNTFGLIREGERERRTTQNRK